MFIWKQMLPTWFDVLEENADVFVSVGADLLMVEAQSVKDLVAHRRGSQTFIFLQRDELPSSLTANVGPTPEIQTQAHAQLTASG